MKHTALSALLLAGLLFNTGCSSKDSNTDMAENANDQKIENNESGAAAMTASSTGDAKDVATYIVDLASTGMTELDMSKMAVERATTPAVKSYAQEVVQAHDKDDQKIKQLASEYNITLPDGLSNDGQEMVMKLKQQNGAEFDKQYLDNMADINDKAISKTKDLADNTDKMDLKEFATKTEGDDTHHRDMAKQLKDQVK